MTKNKKQSNYKVPQFAVYLTLSVSYIICAIALYYMSKNYPYSTNSNIEAKDILNIVDELGNSLTVASGILCILLDILSQKEKKIHPWIKKIIAVSLFVMFNFLRCANSLKMEANQLIVITFVFYAISVVSILMLANSYNPKEKTDDLKLKNILGKIKNQNIASVQLFEVEELKEGEYSKYKFKCIDALWQEESDVNSMLSVVYMIKSEYVSEMRLVLLAYQRWIESGNDIEKEIVASSIRRNKEKLLEELRKIKSIDEVNKEHCCIARMFILYLTIENMLENANCVGIQAIDGILHLSDVEIEKRLFTYFRTGIWGAIFLGRNDIYTFEYWKDGSKTGRRYCAFQVENEERTLICMVVLKEGKNNGKNGLSRDIKEAIKKLEKRLDDSYKQ